LAGCEIAPIPQLQSPHSLVVDSVTAVLAHKRACDPFALAAAAGWRLWRPASFGRLKHALDLSERSGCLIHAELESVFRQDIDLEGSVP
jgi:hypothetical protein